MKIARACLFLLLALPPPARAAQVEAGGESTVKLGACVLQVDGLGEPTGVAFAADGALYVCESLAGRVSRIDSNGKTLESLGLGLLIDPRDVAVCSAGRIAVSDAGLHAIVVFGKDKQPLTIGKRGVANGEFNAPEGIDVSGEFVAIADARNDRVQVLKLDGSFVRVLGRRGEKDGEFNRPSDVAFAPDGSILVADTFNQRVQCFSRDGKFLRAFGTPGPNPGQFGGPTGLALHDGLVHVADRDNSRVQVFTLGGELHSWYGIHALRPREGRGKLHYPLRLALDAAGRRSAIVEPMEDRVQVLGPVDPNVEELPPLPALPPSHYGGAIDADGPLLVLTEPSIPKILLFQLLDGEPIEFGAFGIYGTHTGQLTWPNDVAIDFPTRRIYVADSGAARILAYEFRFDPNAEIGFDPERVRFVAEVDLARAAWARSGSGEQLVIEPAGLWRDGAGGLCIADPRNRAVWRLDATLRNGKYCGLPKECLEPVDGAVWLGDGGKAPKLEQCVVDRLGGRVFALSSGIVIAEGLSRPSSALCTAPGALYVSDEGANSLLRPGREKGLIARGPGLGANELLRPRGLAELPGGRVVVIDWGNHRGLIFDRDGKFIRAFGSQLFIRPTFASMLAKTAEPPLVVPPPPPAAQLPALDGSKPWHSANRCVSNDGQFAVFWRPTPDPIQERQTFSLEVWVTALATPNLLATDLKLKLDAGMPEHGHGINVIPQTTREPDGRFRIEGTRLHMPGRWEVYFDLEHGGRTERAQLTLELE